MKTDVLPEALLDLPALQEKLAGLVGRGNEYSPKIRPAVIATLKEAMAEGRAKAERLLMEDGEGTLCALFVETDDKTGLAKRASPVRIGGALASVIPE